MCKCTCAGEGVVVVILLDRRIPLVTAMVDGNYITNMTRMLACSYSCIVSATSQNIVRAPLIRVVLTSMCAHIHTHTHTRLPFSLVTDHFCYRDCLRAHITTTTEAEVMCPFKDAEFSCDCPISDIEIRAVSTRHVCAVSTRHVC